MSLTSRPWIRRRPIVPAAPPLPVRGYAIAIAFWILFGSYCGGVDGHPFGAIPIMLLGPLNAFLLWQRDPLRISFDPTPAYEFLGFYLGVIGFWVLQSLLRNSASPFLRAILLRALGYAHIFAWGLCGLMVLGLGH